MLSFQLKEKNHSWAVSPQQWHRPKPRTCGLQKGTGAINQFSATKRFAKLVWSTAGWIPPLLGSEIKTVILSRKVPNSLAASSVCWSITTAAFSTGRKTPLWSRCPFCLFMRLLQLIMEGTSGSQGRLHLSGGGPERPGKPDEPQWLYSPLRGSLRVF